MSNLRVAFPLFLDTAPTGNRFQLLLKEAAHIHWENPSLNWQLKHVELTLSFYPHLCLVLVFCSFWCWFFFCYTVCARFFAFRIVVTFTVNLKF